MDLFQYALRLILAISGSSARKKSRFHFHGLPPIYSEVPVFVKRYALFNYRIHVFDMRIGQASCLTVPLL